MLDSMLISLLAFASMPACVIPIAPEFEDPPAQRNFCPELVSADPPLWSTVTAPATEDVTFTITTADPNVSDTLYVRWIADYPPYSAQVTRPIGDRELAPSPDGKPSRSPDSVTPNCSLHVIARGLTQHKIYVAVSDRKFLDPRDPSVPADFQLTTAPKDACVVIGGWLLEMECK
jgi:hypothetical protein